MLCNCFIFYCITKEYCRKNSRNKKKNYLLYSGFKKKNIILFHGARLCPTSQGMYVM